MRWKLILSVAAVAAVALLQTGCLVVDPHEEDVDCSCYEVNDCKTFCDPTTCWQECEGTKTCPDTCPSTDSGGGPGSGATCQSDADCGSGFVCVGDQCRPRDKQKTGNGGICQTCETSYDCADKNSRCVPLGDSVADGTVCSPTCSSNGDCPGNFECVDMGQGIPSQCLPPKDSSGTRSCDSPPSGKECTSSNDCEAGETCVNNTCEAPDDAECSADGDCGDGEVCRDFQCEQKRKAECLTRQDCRTDEVCIDGSCKSRNPSDGCVFNSECDGEALCVDGQCLARCQDRGDCNAREFCRQGLCQPIECRSNPDCPAGNVCVEARCVDACQSGDDCSDGYVCNPNGFCEPDPNVECRSNAECSRDEMCNSGECVKPCDCNQQCPSGEICNMDSGTCENPNEPEPECENDCDCVSGESCMEGSCV